MKEYIMKVTGAALLAAFSEQLAPKSWQKYIKLISGFILISVLLLPFTFKNEMQLFKDFSLNEGDIAKGEEIAQENFNTELCNKVAEDIEKRVLEEFSEKVTAAVSLAADKGGKIEAVKSITLSGKENSKITERLKFVYGTEDVKWNK